MTHLHREDFEPHAIRQARERHGVDLTVADLNRIVGLIESGETMLQGYTENGLQRHAVQWNGKLLPVLFSPVFRHIVTVWPNFKLRRNTRWTGEERRKDFERARR